MSNILITLKFDPDQPGCPTEEQLKEYSKSLDLTLSQFVPGYEGFYVTKSTVKND